MAHTPSDDWRDVHRSSQCAVWARRSGPAVETLSVGQLDEDAARLITPLFDEAIADSGHCIAFHDWWEASGYDPPHRTWWEKWLAAQQKGAIRGVNMLTQSFIVRMGLIVANIKYPHVKFKAFKGRFAYDSVRIGHLPPRPSDPRRRA